MLQLVLAFVVGGIPQLADEGLPVAPFDVTVGRQAVELRQPLVARTPDARLVLLVRPGALGAGVADDDAIDAFRAAVPEGSVRATLRGRDGREFTLEHTGYTWIQGFRGLTLTGDAAAAELPTPGLYASLELDSEVALEGVRVVWLDRGVINVRDVRPRL